MGSCRLFFLKIGMTFASFNLSGTSPVLKDRFIRKVILSASMSLFSFTKLGFRLSSPPALFVSSLDISRSVSSTVVGVTPKSVTPTAPSCTDDSWRSTTLSPPKKLISSTANLEWCYVHFIRDSYSTFIRWVIGPSKNSMELFFKAKFDFKSTWNRDWTTSHHKHPVCQSPARDVEKLTNVRSMYFGMNRIIDNWHRCLVVKWHKRKNCFDK